MPQDLAAGTALRGTRWLNRALVFVVALAICTFLFGAYILLRTPASIPTPDRPKLADVLLALGGLEFLAVGFLITRRQPRNVVGWLLLGIAVLMPLSATQYYQADAHSAPAAFPAPNVVYVVGGFSFTIFSSLLIGGFLVFPDGRLLSRRWLPLVALYAACVAMGVAAPIIDPRVLGSGNAPASAAPLAQVVNFLGFVGIVLVGVGGVVSLFLRYRRGTSEVKRQLRWIFITVVAVMVGFILALPLNSFLFPVLVVAIVFPATIGFAVLKYRLYDVDLVISRAVVYGVLAVMIAVVYIGLVAGVGSIVGRGTGANLILSLVATALVALAFQPARARLQRAANRLVYGKRATPYEVLSELSKRLSEAYASDDLLPRMARALGEGTGAVRSEVWLRVDDELRRVAVWPEVDGVAPGVIPVAGRQLPSLEAGRAVAVRHQGELLGALAVTKREGEELTPIESALVDDLANQAGLMLRNVGLTEALLEKVDELRASRQRLVAAQDEERRRLERNLHDGAQQHLVALRVNLGLARRLARTDPDKASTLLGQLEVAADEAVETLRDLARGIYPPLLADQGLKAALDATARKVTLPVEVIADDVPRYPQEIEAAVYYCCLEALQNVQKYARAQKAIVQLHAENGELRFSVSDDGAGFDPEHRARGAGLRNMVDRLDALGGTLTVTAAMGQGTVVAGTLPALSDAGRRVATSRERG